MIYPITVGLWYEYVDHVLKSTIPDSRTYKSTPIYQKRHTNTISLRQEELKVRHCNEDALINLKNKINGEMKVNYTTLFHDHK